MTAKPRRGRWLIFGCGLTLGAAWLLYVGTSFVSAWLAFESGPKVSLVAGIPCACPLATYRFVPPPSPLLVVASYLVAIPAVVGVALIVHRGLAGLRDVSQAVHRKLRFACDLLLGAMTWMTTLLAAGYAFSLAPDQNWQFAVESAILILVLASFLIVPAILGGVGVAVLRWNEHGRLSSPPPAARE